ncbi:MAG: sugar ABC transporter permease [Chloroflexi bacterium]|nr:sugar ABC transporter permease [Chloroflexota bacterium]MCI0645302.1 sugar ABC transporter permease [Chloroflexota bacterium]MCI0729544.1 sugar ABC transporter permease [Chloroflexota bacterium]
MMEQAYAQRKDYLKGRSSLLTLSKATRRRYLLFLLLVAPAFLLRLTTAAYPILQTIYLSLTNLSILQGDNEFVGLQNYLAMADDYGVRGALTFTIIYVLASTILQLIVGMLIALLLNARFQGRTFARTINLIPWAIPTIVAGYTFRWLLDDQFGLIPHWVYLISGERMVTFISPGGARLAVVLIHVWKDAPFMAVVFLAGLQGVPPDLYEAATVDGANAWQRFWRITIPLIMPLTITMALFRMVWSLAGFDLVYGLTFGGPGVATSVLALQVFREGILFFKFGFASAISVILLMLVAIIGVVGLGLFRRADVTY